MYTKLTAPDGHFYTQAAEVDPAARIFATVVCLGKFDKEENWRLADEAEKAAVEAELAAREGAAE